MATIQIPDSLTDSQRDGYYHAMVPEDAFAVLDYLIENEPGVFDRAVLNTGRLNRLRDLRTKTQETPTP